MSILSNDPTASDPKPALDSTEQPLVDKARPYLAAVTAANVAQVGAAVPGEQPDRAYLEALLHGSWTQPPDLNARRLSPGTEADPVAGAFDDQGFNDTGNPNPTPYSDKVYIDSGFGDRTE